MPKKYLPQALLLFRRPRACFLRSPSLVYKVLPLNKAYLTSTLPLHTWNYTLPDSVLGSFVRMVSGIFMQRGRTLTMLNLFRHLKGLTGTVLAAQASYRVLETSFPTAMAPATFTPRAAPLCTISGTGPLEPQRVRTKGGRELPRTYGALAPQRPQVLGFKKIVRGYKGLPLTLRRGVPSLALNPVGRVGPFPPKQNSLAV